MNWKLALIQHPMYLLMKEDTQCAERTPPWGEPDIETYIARLEENLSAIREFPGLKVGFEWSGLELEMLTEDAPGVFAQMCSLADEGRIEFYNGTYSQPHLQTLSSEANYRQFIYGAGVYRRLCNKQVTVYAHQEASVHDQVPQLLRAFGYRFGTVPRFTSTLAWLDEGELVLFASQGTRFVHGHEFVSWSGLDGTQIPLYLSTEQPNKNEIEDFLTREHVAGLLHSPPILMSIPDLRKIDEEWMEKHREFHLVLLDEALSERFRDAPPRARARFYTNWSYVEGIRADELSRCNRLAEGAALQAETLNAMAYVLLDRPAESTDASWKDILASQHHDVYCFCAPELKDK